MCAGSNLCLLMCVRGPVRSGVGVEERPFLFWELRFQRRSSTYDSPVLPIFHSPFKLFEYCIRSLRIAKAKDIDFGNMNGVCLIPHLRSKSVENVLKACWGPYSVECCLHAVVERVQFIGSFGKRESKTNF